jgi:hypothetical protein
MLSAKDWQDSLLREVGAGLEGLPDQVLSRALDMVTPHLATYWEMYARYAPVYPGLQFLYVKRHCVNVILGQVRDLFQVNVGGATVSQQQLTQNLQKLYENVTAEIRDAEERAKGSRPPAWGTIKNPVVMDARGRVYRTDRPPYPTPTTPDARWNP